MSCSLLAMRAMRCVFQISALRAECLDDAAELRRSHALRDGLEVEEFGKALAIGMVDGLLRVLGQCLPERQLVEPRPQLRLCQLDDLVLRQVDRRHLVVKVE